MSRAFLRLAGLALALVVGIPMFSAFGQAVAETEVIKRNRQGKDALVRSVLPRDSTLVQPAVEVDLGNRRKGVVALYRASEADTNFAGTVLVTGADDELRVTALPPPREVNGVWELDVASIFTVPSDADHRALVVLYRARRLGSDDGPVKAGYVYIFDDPSWTIDEARTERLIGIADAKAARARLTAKR